MFKSYCYKELLEMIRNYKLLIIVIAFAMIGFSNPIFAKLTPEIIKATGYDLNLPEPQAIDSWVQFFKNISTLLVLYIILFSTNISSELSSGSLINLITRGLPRKTVILAKFTVISTLWLISYYLCFTITVLYTPLLLDGTVDKVLIASSLPALFGILMISLSILGAVVTKHPIGSILAPLGLYAASSLLSIIEKVQNYLPTTLMSSLSLITSDSQLVDFNYAIAVTLILVTVSLIGSIIIFNRQSL